MHVRHACALTLALGACAEPPVRWGESATPVTMPATDMRLALDSAGKVRWVPSDPAPSSLPAIADACPGSLRLARAGGPARALPDARSDQDGLGAGHDVEPGGQPVQPREGVSVVAVGREATAAVAAARAHEIRVLEIDGTRDTEGMADLVADHFADYLGP
jgi:hypothetical protein